MIALVLISTMMCSCLVADKGILKLFYRGYYYRFLTGPEFSQCFKVGYGHFMAQCVVSCPVGACKACLLVTF